MPITLFQSSLIDELREEKRRSEKELSIETHQFQIVSIKNSTTNKRERKKRINN